MQNTALKHDEQGFLIGKPVDLSNLYDELKSIGDDIGHIRKMLSKVDLSSQDKAKESTNVNPNSADKNKINSKPDKENIISFPKDRSITGNHSQHGEAGRSTKSFDAESSQFSTIKKISSDIAEKTKNTNSPFFGVQHERKIKLEREPLERDDKGRFVASNKNRELEQEKKLSDRDEKGRFLPKNGLNTDENSTLKGIGDRVRNVGNSITGAIGDLSSQNEQADPSVQAMQEVSSVVSPLGRGLGKVFSSTMGNGVSRGQDRWYRRFLKHQVERGRIDDIANKREQKLLKDIERKQFGEKDKNGLIATLLLAVLGALLSALLPLTKLLGLNKAGSFIEKMLTNKHRSGIPPIVAAGRGKDKDKPDKSSNSGVLATGKENAKDKPEKPKTSRLSAAKGALGKLPIIGALISAAFLAKEVGDNIGSDKTVEEKTKAISGATGSALGGLGGMAAGAMTGAAVGSFIPVIGTTVGAVLGGVLGGFGGVKIGDILGDKFGEWVNELRSSGFIDSLVYSWNFGVAAMQIMWGDFVGATSGLWAGFVEQAKVAWMIMSTLVSNGWLNTINFATRVWDGIQSVFHNSVNFLNSVWNNIKNNFSGVAGFIEGVWTAIAGRFGGVFEFIANAWSLAVDGVLNFIKEKTGIDLSAKWDAAKKAVSDFLGGSSNVVDKISSGISKIGDYFESVGQRADAQVISQQNASSSNLSGTGAAGSPITKKDASNQAMSYFMSQGWSKEQAAGITANLHHESGFDHKIVGDSGKAYGIAQWHPDRQAEFKRVFGKDIRNSTYEEQLAFVNYELTRGTEQRAGSKLKNATNANEAGQIVSKYYERPRDTHGEATKRGATANSLVGGAVISTGSSNSNSFVSSASSNTNTDGLSQAPKTRGERNNNAGNLVYVGQKGARVESQGKFAVFNTQQDGINALYKQLQLYYTGKSKATGGQKLQSVQSIIEKYAPPFENNTKQYIASVSKELGVSPTEKINLNDPTTARVLMKAIVTIENGRNIYSDKMFENAVTGGGGSVLAAGDNSSGIGNDAGGFDLGMSSDAPDLTSIDGMLKAVNSFSGMDRIKTAFITMLKNSASSSGEVSPEINTPKIASSVASVPSIKTPTMPTLSQAPVVATPIAENMKSGGDVSPVSDVSRDISDKRLAHIVTGGYSAQ